MSAWIAGMNFLPLFKFVLLMSLPAFGLVGDGSYYIDDTLIEAEVQKEYDKYFSLLGHPCDYDEYMKSMTPFWHEFFNSPKVHSSVHLDRVFNLKYADIHVNFDEEFQETSKTIYKYADAPNPANDIVPVVVTKDQQEAMERRRCFTGGPIECSKAGKCVCMDNPEWIETELMDEVTGEKLTNQEPVQDPSGSRQACGVKLGKRCYRRSYWLGKIYFDCLDYNFCHDSLNICVPHLKSKRHVYRT